MITKYCTLLCLAISKYQSRVKFNDAMVHAFSPFWTDFLSWEYAAASALHHHQWLMTLPR